GPSSCLADADDGCLPLPSRGRKGHGVARPAVDQGAPQWRGDRHQTARHVSPRWTHDLIGRLTKLVPHHYGRANPSDIPGGAFLNDVRPCEGGFDRLDATIEHAQILA